MNEWGDPTAPDRVTVETLLEITRRYGTPTYAFDVRRLRGQVAKLRAALPAEVELFYSLKANASLGLCDVFADCGIGADVASAGELATAVEAGFPADRIFVAGPYKHPETIDRLRSLPEAILSIDSPSELRMLAQAELPNPAVLRLRPDFESSAVVTAGSECRFGFLLEDLPQCRPHIGPNNIDVIGCHVFAGSQVLDAAAASFHLRGALDLSLRAVDALGISPRFFNLGGGFGIPYGPHQPELNLARVAEELAALVERAAPARIALELGRFFVAEAGWYLTTVVGHQRHQDRPAVVVDGGVHQRADICGMSLRTKAYPPIALDAANSPTVPTAVLGCLSLPADVLAQAASLPELSPGSVLAFGNAGAYGLWSSPVIFHASPLPAEVAFDADDIYLMRPRRPAESILEGQLHVRQAVDV